MPILHETLSDPDVFGGCLILPAHVDLSGFHGDAVIPQGKSNACDQHVLTGFRIKSIRIGGVTRILYREIIKSKIITEVWMQGPGRTVAKLYSLQSNVFTMADKKQSRSECTAHHLRSVPPVLFGGKSIDGPFAVDQYVFHVQSRDHAGKHGHGIPLPGSQIIFLLLIPALDHAGKFRIKITIWNGAKLRPLSQLHLCIAFQEKTGYAVNTSRHKYAAVRRTGKDRCLNKLCIITCSIPLCAEILHVQCHKFRFRHKIQIRLFFAAILHFQKVLRLRLQIKQRSHHRPCRLCQFSIQIQIISFFRLISSAIGKLQSHASGGLI